MKRLLTTAAILTALTAASAAQSAVTAPMAQQLISRTQMIRDRIGVQCQRVMPVGLKRDECEASAYTPYYSIVDSIRKAERNGGDEALKSISKMIDEFESKWKL